MIDQALDSDPAQDLEIAAGLLFDRLIESGDEWTSYELSLLSEAALARDWLTPEEDAAWQDLCESDDEQLC